MIENMINIAEDAVNPPPCELTEENEEETEKWITKEYMLRRCVCSTILEIVKGTFPYTEDYLICSLCESTYSLPLQEDNDL